MTPANTASKEIIAIKSDPMVMQAMNQLNEVKAIQQGVFQQGVHYGPPYKGAKNDTLLKPGATFLQQKYGLHEQHERLETTIFVHPDDLSKSYIIIQDRCRIFNSDGLEVAQCDAACTTFEDKYLYRQGTKLCPVCGGEFIIKGKVEYGGGWLCYKAKGGCGAKFKDDDPAIANQDTEKKLNANPLNMLDTIVAMAQKRAAVRATIKATGVDALFSPGDGVTVDYYDDMDQSNEEVVRLLDKQPEKSAADKVLGNGHDQPRNLVQNAGAPPVASNSGTFWEYDLPALMAHPDLMTAYPKYPHRANAITLLHDGGFFANVSDLSAAVKVVLNRPDKQEAVS